jgi:hypothetical protein
MVTFQTAEVYYDRGFIRFPVNGEIALYIGPFRIMHPVYFVIRKGK